MLTHIDEGVWRVQTPFLIIEPLWPTSTPLTWVESCHKRFWCPTTKIKKVQCGCAPVTTQFIWMLVKKLKKKKTLLHHLLNSRHRWQDGIPDVEVLRRSRADSVTLKALITSYHIFSASLGRKFQRNKIFPVLQEQCFMVIYVGNDNTWRPETTF